MKVPIIQFDDGEEHLESSKFKLELVFDPKGHPDNSLDDDTPTFFMEVFGTRRLFEGCQEREFHIVTEHPVGRNNSVLLLCLEFLPKNQKQKELSCVMIFNIEEEAYVHSFSKFLGKSSRYKKEHNNDRVNEIMLSMRINHGSLKRDPSPDYSVKLLTGSGSYSTIEELLECGDGNKSWVHFTESYNQIISDEDNKFISYLNIPFDANAVGNVPDYNNISFTFPTLKSRQFNSLLPKSWVDDVIVKVYMYWLTKCDHDVYVLDSLNVTSNFGVETTLKNLEKKKIDLFQHRMILMPIIHWSHWSVIAVVRHANYLLGKTDRCCYLLMDSSVDESKSKRVLFAEIDSYTNYLSNVLTRSWEKKYGKQWNNDINQLSLENDTGKYQIDGELLWCIIYCVELKCFILTFVCIYFYDHFYNIAFQSPSSKIVTIVVY